MRTGQSCVFIELPPVPPGGVNAQRHIVLRVVPSWVIPTKFSVKNRPWWCSELYLMEVSRDVEAKKKNQYGKTLR